MRRYVHESHTILIRTQVIIQLSISLARLFKKQVARKECILVETYSRFFLAIYISIQGY